MDILLTEEIDDPSIDALQERYRLVRAPHLWGERAALLERVGDARAVLLRNMTIVDRPFLAAAARLEAIGRIGVGLDNLDLPAIRERGIPLLYPPEENAVSVAEFVFALLLAFARRVPQADRAVREGRWPRGEMTGFELAGKTMGILGLGRIGFRVAMRARAFGMRVLAYDPYLPEQHPSVTESGASLAPLERVLAEADVVTIHLPLTEETRHLLDAPRLERMKPTALLINTARGPIVHEAALTAALEAGAIGGAALDVREEEPPPADSLLHRMPNVLLAPHVASWSAEALHRMIRTVAEDVDRVLSGLPPRNAYRFGA